MLSESKFCLAQPFRKPQRGLFLVWTVFGGCCQPSRPPHSWKSTIPQIQKVWLRCWQCRWMTVVCHVAWHSVSLDTWSNEVSGVVNPLRGSSLQLTLPTRKLFLLMIDRCSSLPYCLESSCRETGLEQQTPQFRTLKAPPVSTHTHTAHKKNLWETVLPRLHR